MVNEAGETVHGPNRPRRLLLGCPDRLGYPARWLPEALLSAVPAATPFAGSPCTDRPRRPATCWVTLASLPEPSISVNRILAASTGLGSLVGRVVGA